MAGSIDLGDSGSNTNRLFNFYSDPLDPTSAVNFSTGDARYVQSAPVGTELMSGTYSINSGNLTLSAGNILFGAAVNINAGANRITNVTNPINPQDAATKFYIDSLLGGVGNAVNFNRLIFVGDGITTSFITTPFLYISGTNTLSVYVNGVKQIASQFATKYIQNIGPVSMTAPTPLLPSTAYQFQLQVDGGAITPITITTGAGTTTYNDLVNLINAGIFAAYGSQVANSIGQAILLTSSVLISVGSSTIGSGSSIELLDGVGPVPLPLITALATAIVVPPGPVSIVADQSFEEAGIPFTTSSVFTFNTAPSPSDVIEAVIATS